MRFFLLFQVSRSTFFEAKLGFIYNFCGSKPDTTASCDKLLTKVATFTDPSLGHPPFHILTPPLPPNLIKSEGAPYQTSFSKRGVWKSSLRPNSQHSSHVNETSLPFRGTQAHVIAVKPPRCGALPSLLNPHTLAGKVQNYSHPPHDMGHRKEQCW